MLVNFYAPWSSFCKVFAPEYSITAAYVTYNEIKAVIAKVDADSTAGGRALRDKYNVTGYPTLIWFVDGKPQPYGGSLNNYSDIAFWVVAQTAVSPPPSSTAALSSPPSTTTSNINSFALSAGALAAIIICVILAHLINALIFCRTKKLSVTDHSKWILAALISGLFIWLIWWLIRWQNSRSESLKEMDHVEYRPVSYTHLTLPTICSV